jgi:hypothetical protein
MSKTPRAALRGFILTGQAPRPRDADEARALADAAREQGVASLLHHAVAKTRDGWPADVERLLRDQQKVVLVRAVRQLDLARRAALLLGQHGLRSLPLKGAAVAERLYEHVTDRPMDDVDLLVLDDWPRAVAVLREQGFEERERADHAWAFRDPVSGIVLELHHSIVSCPGLFPVDADAFWARSAASAADVRRSSPEDLLVQLSLHAAFQHGLVLRLVQYLDFRKLLEREPIDVDRLQAAAGPALPAVAASLEAARATVGAPISRSLEALVASRMSSGLRRFLAQHLSDPLRVLVPASAPIARARWELARGRRLDLIRRTLVSSEPRAGRWHRLGAAAARGIALVRRWALPTLRTW